MAIFISHAAADAEAAQGLEKFLERRGHFVELDDGETALRPLHTGDVLVLLISQQLVMTPFRLRLEQRALDAWTDGSLVLVKLDHGFAPVGLRDLPAIDASFEAQREFKWGEVAGAVAEKLRAPAPTLPSETEDAKPAPVRALKRKRRGGPVRSVLSFVLILPGAYALWAAIFMVLANRIQATPAGLTHLRHGLDDLYARYGVPEGSWVAAGSVGLAVLVLLVGLVGLLFKSRPRDEDADEDNEAPPAPTRISNRPTEALSDAVFVSYARANSGLVLPVIDAAKREGRHFWLDQQNAKPGESWAGDIVRAIKGAPVVLVMCSKAAFESDHVRREVYLADRYKRKLAPVFIEAAELPEDFEYFFAGVQWLKLFETPEAERAAALMQVLETA